MRRSSEHRVHHRLLSAVRSVSRLLREVEANRDGRVASRFRNRFAVPYHRVGSPHTLLGDLVVPRSPSSSRSGQHRHSSSSVRSDNQPFRLIHPTRTARLMGEHQTEDEILAELHAHGIVRPIPTNGTAVDPCLVCREPTAENDHNTLNLGPPDYCSLACRLEAEDG